MNVTGENQSAWRQPYAISTFPTTNPTRTGTGIELESLWWQACLDHGMSLILPPRLTVLPSANSSYITSLLKHSYCKLLHFRISLSTITMQLIVCSNLKIIFPADPKSSSYPSPCVPVLPFCRLSVYTPYIYTYFRAALGSICNNAVSVVYKQMSSTPQGVVLRIWKPFPHP